MIDDKNESIESKLKRAKSCDRNKSYLSPREFFHNVLESSPFLTKVYVKATELSHYLPTF